MGYRLSKIVTRTGDSGTTGLASGERLSKAHPRIEALGLVDALNAQIGVLLTELNPQQHEATELIRVQHVLFELGGELCLPGHERMQEQHSSHLEQVVSEWNDALPPLKEFILPGGSKAAAQAHVARTTCRMAEIAVVRLADSGEKPNPFALTYLNRLSDFLFVLARRLNQLYGMPDHCWKPGNF